MTSIKAVMTAAFIVALLATVFGAAAAPANLILAVWLALAIASLVVVFVHWHAPERTMSETIQEARR
jgi:hypothetical protein